MQIQVNQRGLRRDLHSRERRTVVFDDDDVKLDGERIDGLLALEAHGRARRVLQVRRGARGSAQDSRSERIESERTWQTGMV